MKIVKQLLLTNNNSGGNVYEKYIANISTDNNIAYQQLVLNNNADIGKFKKLINLIKVLYKYSKNSYNTVDITIRSLSSIYNLSKRSKDIVIFHHYDPKHYPLSISIFQKILFLNLKLNLKKIDKIVVVSEYWKQYLLTKGVPENKITTIHNSFEVERYNLENLDKRIKDFKKKYNLQKKSIVYIGNPQKIKGADIVYQALKDLDIHLVTTGKGDLKLPCLHLDLSFEEYILLLHSSLIVVLMSQFNEGWNRVAHEAMLCNCVVVGSGKGGMRELLQGGKQLICEDSSKLYSTMNVLINDRDELNDMAYQGYQYASKFTIDSFTKEWLKCIKSL